MVPNASSYHYTIHSLNVEGNQYNCWATNIDKKKWEFCKLQLNFFFFKPKKIEWIDSIAAADPCNQYSNNCSECLQNGCGFCLTSPQFSNYSVCANKSNPTINKTCTIPQMLNGDWITSGTTCPGKQLCVFFLHFPFVSYNSTNFFIV